MYRLDAGPVGSNVCTALLVEAVAFGALRFPLGRGERRYSRDAGPDIDCDGVALAEELDGPEDTSKPDFCCGSLAEVVPSVPIQSTSLGSHVARLLLLQFCC